MRRSHGFLLLGVGALHTLFGLVAGRAALAEMARPGSVHTVGGLSRPSLLFWFLMFGFVLLPLGHLCFWVERRLGRPLPAFLGWELLAVAMIGVVLDPRSGFWLGLALGASVALGARHGVNAACRGATGITGREFTGSGRVARKAPGPAAGAGSARERWLD